MMILVSSNLRLKVRFAWNFCGCQRFSSLLSTLHEKSSAVLVDKSPFPAAKDAPDVSLLPKYTLAQSRIRARTTPVNDTQIDHNIEGPVRLLEQQLSSNKRVTLKSVEDVIAVARGDGSFRTEKIDLSSSLGLFLISCCGRNMPGETAENKKKLCDVILHLLKTKQALDISHCNALLQTYLENSLSFRPVQFLRGLAEKQIEPNRVTFQRLIARYCHMGDMDAANALVSEMQQRNLKINEYVYLPLLFGYAKLQDDANIQNVLTKMKDAGLPSDLSTHLSIARGYAAAGDIIRLNKALTDVIAYGPLSNEDYFEVVVTLAQNGFTEHIGPLLDKLDRRSFDPNTAVNSAMRLIMHGCSDAAFEILLNLCSQQLDGEQRRDELTEHGGFFFSALLKSNCSVDKIIAYCKVLEEKDCLNRPFDKALYCAFNQNKISVAVKLMRWCQDSGRSLRVQYFHPLLHYFAQSGRVDDLVKTLEWMYSANVSIDRETVEKFVLSLRTVTLDDIVQRTAALNHLVSVDKQVTQRSPVNPFIAEATFSTPAKAIQELHHIFDQFCDRKPDGSELDARLKDIERAERIVQVLKQRNQLITPRATLYLCSMHTTMQNVDQAVGFYEETKSLSLKTGLPISLAPLFKLAILLLEHRKLDHVLRLFEDSRLFQRQILMYPAAVLRELLHIAHANGPAQFSRELIRSLSACFRQSRGVFYEHLVCAELQRNDVNKAISAYTEQAAVCNETRGRGEIMKILIANNDQDSLQNVFDVDAKVHGVDAAVLNFAMTLIEAGKICEAQQLLSDPKLFVSRDQLNDYCRRFSMLNKPDYLKALLLVSKKIQCPRVVPYSHLISHYAGKNDWSAALDAWESMQEENICASNGVLRKLAGALRRNKQPIPFAVATAQQGEQAQEKSSATSVSRSPVHIALKCPPPLQDNHPFPPKESLEERVDFSPDASNDSSLQSAAVGVS